MIFTKLPNPIRETRVLKLVFTMTPCHKFWALRIKWHAYDKDGAAFNFSQDFLVSILHHPCIHTYTSFHIFPVLGLTNTAESPGSAYILSLSWCIILNKKNYKGLSRDHRNNRWSRAQNVIYNKCMKYTCSMETVKHNGGFTVFFLLNSTLY